MDRAKQEQIVIDKFIKVRNKAFTDAVLRNEWQGVKEYCETYRVPIPENETVFKLAVYKAVCSLSTIPNRVKKVAAVKCEELGFTSDLRLEE